MVHEPCPVVGARQGRTPAASPAASACTRSQGRTGHAPVLTHCRQALELTWAGPRPGAPRAAVACASTSGLLRCSRSRSMVGEALVPSLADDEWQLCNASTHGGPDDE